MGSLLRLAAAVAAPPRCGACGAPVRGSPLCDGCRAELAATPHTADAALPGIDVAVSACAFEGAARALVHGLKYGRRLALAVVAAEAMAEACPEAELQGTVVPVPPSQLRWLWRGFDPAEEIALALARGVGLPYCACLRRAHGPRQVGRARAARMSDPPRVHLSGAAPRRALLVDDVRTTGATLGACAAALRSGGTDEVTALTFARVRLPA